MKNIHILQTEKSSRLFLNMNDELSLFKNYSEHKGFVSNQNIYITSDVEIKESGYVFWEGKVYRYKDFMNMRTPVYTDYFSIILTTDTDLIKNGVQAIDDSFLEWFIKNPSCEKVEVDWVDFSWAYFIKIPKKEFKNPNNQEVMFHQEHQEYFNEDIVDGKKIVVWLGKDYVSKEKPKQETLEEAAESLVPKAGCELNNSEASYWQQGWINGYIKGTWQQENSYSEEEVLELLLNRPGPYLRDNEIKEWFEQFKKK